MIPFLRQPEDAFPLTVAVEFANGGDAEVEVANVDELHCWLKNLDAPNRFPADITLKFSDLWCLITADSGLAAGDEAILMIDEWITVDHRQLAATG